ncbi:hypothetical protein C8R45DRAFT_209332 [Mycena sanguinolenta]|nr:hypothetical protein C8R45DRAFT_209332 [Mycena sanguinolenta]
MIPIVPTLALAFLSFLSSAFIILRIVLPILPPHPLSRRVAPSEFGLPNYRTLNVADKSHLWFASLDILALAFFIWESIDQYTGGPSDASIAVAPGSSLRLWIALTVRQTCLLMSLGLALLHVRMGRSVSYGKKHWMLWAPTLVLVASSTGIAVVLSGAEVPSLFIGLISYTTTIAVMSSIAFCCLVGTLLAIKRNLAAVEEESEPWPAVRQMEQQPRPSFTTEEIDAIRDGASWITSNASNASSRHNSISAWSFSTHAPSHGGRPQGSHPSVPAKSSFWFSSSTPPDAPPVPPLPSPYGPLSPTAQSLSDPDPFHRDALEPRPRLDSQTSWLTSTNGSHKTVISAWSYPTTHHQEEHEGSLNGSTNNLNAELLPSSHTAISRPVTPAMASAKVLGGYGFSPAVTDTEKNLAALAAAPSATVDISVYRAIGWLITIWVPLTLSLPYLLLATHSSHTPTPASILLVLSVTISSPLLALNLLFRSPLPIPQGLFDLRGDLPANTCRGPSVAGSTPTYSHEYKRSTSASVTVVEGRRSGDVWLTNGDAVDGKNKMGRAIGMMAPTPKLSVLPPEEDDNEPLTPPLPMQNDDSSLPVSIHNSTIQNSTQSEMSAQFGRLRKDSKASSHLSAADESLAYASRIMVAQRHYSALAQTMRVDGGSPEKHTTVGGHLAAASGVGPHKSARNSAHLRTRSSSSIQQSPTTESFNISPPPAFPLPPTPPNVRAARLAHLKHRKSFSSGFSFGAVDDMNEIDALTAGVLPLLVPGLKVGENMKIKEGDWTPPNSYSRARGKRAARQLLEFGEDFSSPQIHSTPARTRGAQPRPKKTSMHKRHHFSLPSLGLGKDGVHSLANWKDEVGRALESKVGQYTAVPSNVTLDVRRATVFGGESISNTLQPLRAVSENEDEEPRPAKLVRGLSSRRLGLQASVPHSAHGSMESLRMSMNIDVIPPSAASTATLFDFEAGMDSGPQAESTPHNSVAAKPVSKQRPPPLPLPVPNHVKSSRRSSIVYITSSDDNFSPRTPATGAENTPTTPSAMASLAQWSSRVIAKPGKLQRKISNAVHSATVKPGSPGLRPLTLLQDRDTNASGGGTPPLSLRKKHNKLRVANDENTAPLADRGKGRGVLKPLGLVRTETRQHTEVA